MNHEFLIMNYLGGVVERDARPPMISNGNGFNFFNFSNFFNSSLPPPELKKSCRNVCRVA